MIKSKNCFTDPVRILLELPDGGHADVLVDQRSSAGHVLSSRFGYRASSYAPNLLIRAGSALYCVDRDSPLASYGIRAGDIIRIITKDDQPEG